MGGAYAEGGVLRHPFQPHIKYRLTPARTHRTHKEHWFHKALVGPCAILLYKASCTRYTAYRLSILLLLSSIRDGQGYDQHQS